MGVRSDVGLAIKRNAYTSLTVEQRDKIADILKEVTATLEHDEGFLFTWEDVKWYTETYKEIVDLYKVLDELQPADFSLVVATPEDPLDTSDDRGDWYDNPWNLHKYVACTLEFDNV